MRDAFYFSPVFLLVAFFNLIGEELSKKIIRAFIFTSKSKRQKIALDNIAHAFPEWSADEHKALYQRVIDCFIVPCFLCDIIFARKRLKYSKRALKVVDDGIEEVFSDPKNQIIFLPHFANFNLVTIALFHLNIALRPFRTGYRNRFIAALVARNTSKHIDSLNEDKYSDVRRTVKLLKQGERICFSVDQYAHGNAGIDVMFFLRPTRIAAMPFKCAVAHDTSITLVFLKVEKNDKNAFIIKVSHEPPLCRDPKSKNPVQDLANRCMAVLEKKIREEPESWLWLHRFWR
jgi:KDO2-lipid IV(A) lauroyltransferase